MSDHPKWQRRGYGPRSIYGRLQRWLSEDGYPGRRYTPAELVRWTGVQRCTVMRWLELGWLKASKTSLGGYRIRKRAIRRLFADHPSVWPVVMKAQMRKHLRDKARIQGAGQRVDEDKAA